MFGLLSGELESGLIALVVLGAAAALILFLGAFVLSFARRKR